MINLLPEEYKAHLRREYRLRFFVLSTLFVIFAVVIGVVALVPGSISIGEDYFLGNAQDNRTPATDEPQKNQETLQALKDFQSTLLVLDPKKEGTEVPLSDLIRLVVQQKPIKVSLDSFSFATENEETKRLVVSGHASDRESLVSFSQRLSGNNTFAQVDLPISNLSKKENIDFSISLSIKTKKK